MRMWGVPPELLCNPRLLGEHVEMHMFLGALRKHISIQGYVDRGLVNPALIYSRHEELSHEMLRRGMNHNSPFLPHRREPFLPVVDVAANLVELARWCPTCRQRIEA